MIAKHTKSSTTSSSSKKSSRDTGNPNTENLPPVSKQTAGGIVGAAMGGVIGGPVGAVIGGVAGAMVGNASAAGQHPIETAVDSIRTVTEKPLKKAVARVSKALGGTSGSSKRRSPQATKASTKKKAKRTSTKS